MGVEITAMRGEMEKKIIHNQGHQTPGIIRGQTRKDN